MSTMILVVGEPGSGKSTAIENLNPDSTVIIKPNNKPLPFKGSVGKYNVEKKNVVICKEFKELETLLTSINKSTTGKVKTVIIEDLTHYFSNRVMKDAKVTGFQKWTDMASEFFNALIKLESDLREDLNIIVIGHVDRVSDAAGNATIGLQTPGRLLDNVIKIPSYFTYVLHAEVSESNGKMEYRFLTNTDGIKLAKSPRGCFEKYIPNDYQLVIETINKYQKGE